MKKIILILFLVSVFLFTFLPVKDTDFGWHYRCGDQFLKTGKLCLKNEFSYFLPNYQAYNPSFLYDIVLAFIYNHFGFLGVSFLGSIILTLSAFFIFKLLSGPCWFRIIAFYLIFLLSYSIFSLGLRSQIVSFLFFVVTLSILEQTRRKQELFFGSKIHQKTSNNCQQQHPIENQKANGLLIKAHNFPFSANNKERYTQLTKINIPNNNIIQLIVSIFKKAGNTTEAKATSEILVKRLDRARNFERANFIIKNDFNSFIYHLSILLPLFILWVNTHIGFFLGPILLTIFLISQTVVNFNKKSIIFHFSFLIFNFFITFLNPFGPKVYLEIFRHAQAPLNTMIAEWVAPPFWQRILILFSMIIGLTLTIINRWRKPESPNKSAVDEAVVILSKDLSLNQPSLDKKEKKETKREFIGDGERQNLLIFHFFLLFLFSLLAFFARRNLPYFYTTLFYTLLSFYSKNERRSLKRPFKSDTNVKFLTLSLLISLIFFLTVTQIPKTIAFDQSWKNYCQNALLPLPCQVIEKTGLKKLSGNLYTAYEWGGFLIWQAPNLKVFVDGRMSAWKGEKEPYPGSGHYPYQVYLYIIQAREDWDKILKKYHTDYLLIGNGTFLDLELQKNGEKYGFKEKYRDQTAVFYTYTNTN